MPLQTMLTLPRRWLAYANCSDALRQACRIFVYEVATSTEVGVIFETLNERGRPLSELEKTKNYLLYLATPDPRRTSG